MKRSDILLVAVLFVMGSLIFAIKKSQDENGGDTLAVPVPGLKQGTTPLPQTKAPSRQLELSVPVDAGSHGRLSLDKFLSKTLPHVEIKETGSKKTTPQNTAAKDSGKNSVIKRPRQNRNGDQAIINHKPNIKLSSLKVETAEAINLPYLPEIDEARFVNRVIEMAEASPIQPDARSCGTLNSNLKSAPKHAKVRSVGIERQLTDRASIGVEYVYKDGCYKNSIAPLKSLDMPGDDGVNLRVNMQF